MFRQKNRSGSKGKRQDHKIIVHCIFSVKELDPASFAIVEANLLVIGGPDVAAVVLARF